MPECRGRIGPVEPSPAACFNDDWHRELIAMDDLFNQLKNTIIFPFPVEKVLEAYELFVNARKADLAKAGKEKIKELDATVRDVFDTCDVMLRLRNEPGDLDGRFALRKLEHDWFKDVLAALSNAT